MPATSQQGFTCAACILATGAVGLLCTFAGGAACASRVAGERFSTTMTAKATVADFFVITDLRLTQPNTLGKVVSALQPPTAALQARGEQAEPLFCGPHRKGKSPTVKHTGGPTRIVGGGAGPSGQNLLRGLHPFTVCMRASVGRKLPRRGQPVAPKHPRNPNFKFPALKQGGRRNLFRRCHEKANTSFPVTCHRVAGSRNGGTEFPPQRTTGFQFACGYPSTGAGAARAAACPAAGATGCPGGTTSRSPKLHGHDREVRRQIRTARLRNRHYIRYRSPGRGEQARREKSSRDRHTRSEWKDDSFATERTLKTALEPQ